MGWAQFSPVQLWEACDNGVMAHDSRLRIAVMCCIAAPAQSCSRQYTYCSGVSAILFQDSLNVGRHSGPCHVCCCFCRYDDLSNYVNERSLWVAKLRDTIEEPWQEWELGQLLASPDVAQGETGGSIDGYKGLSVQTLKEALKNR